MTSDLIQCDEYKMTNPYCASRLTREYNKINDAKNGSCIVTNFATDKYIFSDGKYNIIILTVKSYFWHISASNRLSSPRTLSPQP